jgi:2-polyprenyl-3-methyl-5-hydroxy-6-metoxy-1,4-benzoquinol methylase
MGIDKEKPEVFGENLLDMLNHGALALMISIGHRTGLFDIMDGLSGSTCQEIAHEAGLNERYVREWLGAMVSGKIVDYESLSRKYSLPVEHSQWLTRKASPNNMAVFAQYISVMGSVEDKIVDCFDRGGGVPYEEFKRFHQVMAEDSFQTVVSALIEHILPLVPGLTDSLEQGIRVMDVGCGSGLALILLAKNFPKSEFFGIDLSREAIENGAKEASENGATNLNLEVMDVSDWNAKEAYDLITTFDAVHDQAKPDMVLKKICHALKSAGTYLMQDIAGSSRLENNLDHPAAPFLYTISCMHCMTVSLAQNGAGLGAMWGRELAVEMLKAAGFSQIDVKQLPHDFQNYFYVVTKS